MQAPHGSCRHCYGRVPCVRSDPLLRLRSRNDTDAGLRAVLPDTRCDRCDRRRPFGEQSVQARAHGAEGQLAGGSALRHSCLPGGDRGCPRAFSVRGDAGDRRL